MRAAIIGALCLLSGCFNPKYQSGDLRCDADNACPKGFHCAANHTCWQGNHNPVLDLSIPIAVDAGVDAGDAAVPGDAASLEDAAPAGSDLSKGVKHQGEACGDGDTCETGNCVDGYCCDSACNNTCQACNVPGSLGICSNIGAGATPVGSRSCNAEDAATCGRDGKCDGMGNCRDWPSGTVCVAGTCNLANGNYVDPSTCNGVGACVANGSGNCSPYKCEDATQCWSSCSDGSHCSGSNSCVGGSCGPLPNGRSCGTNGAQCMSGNCVDGYCCDSPCTNACQACDVPGSFGTCTTVAAGSPHGTTRTCNNLGIGTCGGSCNGSQGTCFYPDNTTACKTECTSMTQLTHSFCDHNGSCVAAAPITCANNFKCAVSSCLGQCSNDQDCANGSFGCTAANACVSFCSLDDSNLDECISK
jgi:hypothetical protein